ncbi:MAG TPA: flagellar hook-basal body complex protein FliE [Candidatus Baltobacteraceae bacterium]|jgi:flagellar hook-basal body complex protein FliE|nr:flagellar hook-basal body complex protein FliE [Candidatus Baltobacteraceae bacterium]
MKVELLHPDLPAAPERSAGGSDAAKLFADVAQALGATLDRADKAENAFAGGAGSLQAAVYERARADVALSVATAAAQRATQAIQSILNMQV